MMAYNRLNFVGVIFLLMSDRAGSDKRDRKLKVSTDWIRAVLVEVHADTARYIWQ